jgi:regulator of sigma E protease
MAFLIFIVVLSILVFVHELGHFWVARRFKIGVHEFGFGFPPKLWGIRRKDVLYSINAIPFGGFVRLVGEGEGEENAPNSFLRASIPKRLAVLLAGVCMNLLLAWVLLSAVLAIGIRVDLNSPRLLKDGSISQIQTEAFISPDSSAAEAGLMAGDIVKTVNDQPLTSTAMLIEFTKKNNFPPLVLEVDRDGQAKTITVQPKLPSEPNTPVYGFGIYQTGLIQYPVWQAPVAGLRVTGIFTVETVKGLGRFLSDLITQGRVAEDVAGPIGIAVLTSEISQLGLGPLLQFMAILSISLAVMNALPLPALDGGRVLFTVIEGLRGRPVNANRERLIHSIGFITLLVLIAFISVRDVRKFEVWDRIVNLFQ